MAGMGPLCDGSLAFNPIRVGGLFTQEPSFEQGHPL